MHLRKYFEDEKRSIIDLYRFNKRMVVNSTDLYGQCEYS